MSSTASAAGPRAASDQDYFSKLPLELTLKIMSSFSYDQISNLRSVSPSMNQICINRLNLGLESMMSLNARMLSNLKQQLPRRDSKRDEHPLISHHKVLESIDGIMSLIKMIYGRAIRASVCCIPGKVLDEGFRVLRLVQSSMADDEPESLEEHDMLQEMRELSMMAQEHFEESVEPGLNLQLDREAQESRAAAPVAFVPLVEPVPIAMEEDIAPTQHPKDTDKLQLRVKSLENQLCKTQRRVKQQQQQLNKQHKLFNKKIHHLAHLIKNLTKRSVSAPKMADLDDMMSEEVCTLPPIVVNVLHLDIEDDQDTQVRSTTNALHYCNE